MKHDHDAENSSYNKEKEEKQTLKKEQFSYLKETALNSRKVLHKSIVQSTPSSPNMKQGQGEVE